MNNNNQRGRNARAGGGRAPDQGQRQNNLVVATAKPKEPNEPLEVSLRANNFVTDFVRIYVGDRNTTVADMIVHRPIGQNGLSPEDWVISSPSQVQDLINRRINPNASNLLARRSRWKRDTAVTEGLIILGDENEILYPTGENRLDAIVEAKRVCSVAQRNMRDPPNVELRSTWLPHLPEAIRDFEIAYHTFTADPAVTARVEAAVPDTYVTTWGPNFSPQVAAGNLHGHTREALGQIILGNITNPGVAEPWTIHGRSQMAIDRILEGIEHLLTLLPILRSVVTYFQSIRIQFKSNRRRGQGSNQSVAESLPSFIGQEEEGGYDE